MDTPMLTLSPGSPITFALERCEIAYKTSGRTPSFQEADGVAAIAAIDRVAAELGPFERLFPWICIYDDEMPES